MREALTRSCGCSGTLAAADQAPVQRLIRRVRITTDTSTNDSRRCSLGCLRHSRVVRPFIFRHMYDISVARSVGVHSTPALNHKDKYKLPENQRVVNLNNRVSTQRYCHGPTNFAVHRVKLHVLWPSTSHSLLVPHLFVHHSWVDAIHRSISCAE